VPDAEAAPVAGEAGLAVPDAEAFPPFRSMNETGDAGLVSGLRRVGWYAARTMLADPAAMEAPVAVVSGGRSSRSGSAARWTWLSGMMTTLEQLSRRAVTTSSASGCSSVAGWPMVKVGVPSRARVHLRGTVGAPSPLRDVVTEMPKSGQYRHSGVESSPLVTKYMRLRRRTLSGRMMERPWGEARSSTMRAYSSTSSGETPRRSNVPAAGSGWAFAAARAGGVVRWVAAASVARVKKDLT
jgi:hypothetical protein